MIRMQNNIKENIIKIKNNKYFVIFVAVILIIILLIAYYFVSKANDNIPESDESTTSASLTENIEHRLTDIINDMDGISNANVLISYASTAETIYENVSSNQLFEENELVEVKELLPEIIGVVVVAEGIEKIKAKVNIVNAVMTVLGIGADKIQVFLK